MQSLCLIVYLLLTGCGLLVTTPSIKSTNQTGSTRHKTEDGSLHRLLVPNTHTDTHILKENAAAAEAEI